MSTRYSKTVYKWLKNIHYVLLPGSCIICQQQSLRDKDLCSPCEESLVAIQKPCSICGLPLPPGTLLTNQCGRCMVFPPPFGRMIAPFSYRPPISGLIAGYKYNRKLVNGRVLSTLLCDILKRQYQTDTLPSLIIPVPLHPARTRKRGFNQALIISKYLSATLAIPHERGLISRIKQTDHQTGLNVKARAKNIRSAFQIKPDFQFKPKTKIALVDDVVTTTATVTELSKVFLKAGAEEVHIWAIARTIS